MKSDFRAEIIQHIRHGLTMAKLRNARLFKSVLDKNPEKSRQGVDDLAHEVSKSIPEYDAKLADITDYGPSVDCGLGTKDDL